MTLDADYRGDEAILTLSREPMPLVYTVKGVKRRRIRATDLGSYQRPEILGNRNVAWRAS